MFGSCKGGYQLVYLVEQSITECEVVVCILCGRVLLSVGFYKCKVSLCTHRYKQSPQVALCTYLRQPTGV